MELIAPDTNTEKSLKEFYQPLAAMMFVVQTHIEAFSEAVAELYFQPKIADFSHLSEFDCRAGELGISLRENGRLSMEAVLAIAKELDASGIELKHSLQPAQWKLISEHNQKFSKKPIRTFEAALRHTKFVRQIRKRLCLACDRYASALKSAS